MPLRLMTPAEKIWGFFMKHLVFIALGGGLGALSRYWISVCFQNLFNRLLPVGTFL